MTDRHYDDDEVAAIFRAATECAERSESRALAERSANGLTLADLHAIAREVGISPDAVTRAARALDRPRVEYENVTLLGLPIGIERTAVLDRRLTDAEWELLVVELREVFDARGVMRTQGSLREWRNGNLHAYLEPTPTGSRLRLGTMKRSASAAITAGSAAMVAALIIGVTQVLSADILVALSTLGTIVLVAGIIPLPGWARLRGEQIDGIVERLTQGTRSEP